MLIGLGVFLGLFLGFQGYFEMSKHNTPSSNWLEGDTSSKSTITDLWCLELFDEEDRKELGYLKGDFLDELVCREDLQNMKNDLENVPYSKVKDFFDNP